MNTVETFWELETIKTTNEGEDKENIWTSLKTNANLCKTYKHHWRNKWKSLKTTMKLIGKTWSRWKNMKLIAQPMEILWKRMEVIKQLEKIVETTNGNHWKLMEIIRGSSNSFKHFAKPWSLRVIQPASGRHRGRPEAAPITPRSGLDDATPFFLMNLVWLSSLFLWFSLFSHGFPSFSECSS